MLPEDDDGKKEGAFADRALVLKFPPLAAPLPPLGLDWDMLVVMVVVVRNPMLLQCKGRYDQTNSVAIGHRPSPWNDGMTTLYVRIDTYTYVHKR